MCGAACGFTINRQTHRDASALARTAAHHQFAIVEADQSLDDGKTEARAVMRAVVGTLCLEELVADLRHVFSRNADTVVFDGNKNVTALGARSNFHPTAAIGELDRVGHQVDHDLLERALVGVDFRQIARQIEFEFKTAFNQLERKQIAASGYYRRGLEGFGPDHEFASVDLRHIQNAVHD